MTRPHSYFPKTIRPAWWARPWPRALAYLAAIPLFALVYAFFPSEFYHSTVVHETYLNLDERRILDALLAAMEPQPGINAAPERPSQGLSWHNVRLFDLRSEGIDKFSFTFLGGLGSPPSSSVDNALRCEVDLYWRRQAISGPPSWAYPLRFLNLKGNEDLASQFFPLPQRFRESGEIDATGGTIGYLVLPDSLLAAIRTWRDANEGFPSQSSGNYSRMLYLSAITITTVGFGDIVPISNRARIMVAIEAVLGVVLIGFFLNAAATKAAGARCDVG